MSESPRTPPRPPRGPKRHDPASRTPRLTAPAAPDLPGLGARRAAVEALDAVLTSGRPLEEALDRLTKGLEDRDRGLARMIAATALRRLGSLRALIRSRLERPLPEKARHVEWLMVVGAAQILFLDVPDHAAVATSVELAGQSPSTAGFKGLINAVLRRIARDGRPALEALDAPDLPEWLTAGWRRAYGEATARDMAAAIIREAPLDLTVKGDPAHWAQTLGGTVLPTGSVRLVEAGNVTALPGFTEGAWWVQDAAAAIPARLLAAAPGRRIADLCAAPGGKTAQLAAAGAQVTALDRSASRLARLEQNLARLGLTAEVVAADATSWQGGPFDAVLIDAPCSATGTIRRHPDVAWTKAPGDLTSLTALQARLLRNAAGLIAPGGVLVYSTCSLESEEGELQIEAFLATQPDFERLPVTPGEAGIAADWINAAGEVRTLPTHLPDEDPRRSGLDGFFAARLRRVGISAA